jgi:hypothetical protein
MLQAMNDELKWRIIGGLFLGLYTYGSRVKDQVYLVKGKASEQDVLTRRRQIATDYTFFSDFGLNYRFGSKLNDFVNPRMGGYKSYKKKIILQQRFTSLVPSTI